MKKKNSAAKNRPPEKIRNPAAKVTIRKIGSGVRGLDDIMGGGIPEFSFNVIAGSPGSGKTTLAHQIVFANGTTKKPALYFTVLGESAMKMLRYQQQYSFFDESKLGKAIRFVNLADVVMGKDLNAVLEEIIKQVTAVNPGIVVTEGTATAGFVGSEFFDGIVTQTPLGRAGQPDDIASIVTFLASDDAKWLTGELITASGGLR